VSGSSSSGRGAARQVVLLAVLHPRVLRAWRHERHVLAARCRGRRPPGRSARGASGSCQSPAKPSVSVLRRVRQRADSGDRLDPPVRDGRVGRESAAAAHADGRDASCVDLVPAGQEGDRVLNVLGFGEGVLVAARRALALAVAGMVESKGGVPQGGQAPGVDGGGLLLGSPTTPLPRPRPGRRSVAGRSSGRYMWPASLRPSLRNVMSSRTGLPLIHLADRSSACSKL